VNAQETLAHRTSLIAVIRSAGDELAVSFADRNLYSTCFAALARIEAETATLIESVRKIADEKK
jgi:hypothetical protein